MSLLIPNFEQRIETYMCLIDKEVKVRQLEKENKKNFEEIQYLKSSLKATQNTAEKQMKRLGEEIESLKSSLRQLQSIVNQK